MFCFYNLKMLSVYNLKSIYSQELRSQATLNHFIHLAVFTLQRSIHWPIAANSIRVEAPDPSGAASRLSGMNR